MSDQAESHHEPPDKPRMIASLNLCAPRSTNLVTHVSMRLGENNPQDCRRTVQKSFVVPTATTKQQRQRAEEKTPQEGNSDPKRSEEESTRRFISADNTSTSENYGNPLADRRRLHRASGSSGKRQGGSPSVITGRYIALGDPGVCR
jgi:hypothetical protein